MNIVLLAGGVGAARFLEGLVQVADPRGITVIANTGDDEEFYGLHVSPDIDTIIYTLSGLTDPSQGWGIKGDTFRVMEALRRLGHEAWFALGDRDLATHIHRTLMLRRGETLTEATADLAERYGLEVTLLPMTNDRVKTLVKTPTLTLPFQEYFVKRRYRDPVVAIDYSGIKTAAAAPGVAGAINRADIIIIAPSNPVVSIGTILAVPGIKEKIKQAQAKKIAISPLIGGKTVKGPADRMLEGLGFGATSIGVALYYRDFLDTLVIDRADEAERHEIERLGINVAVADTLMKDKETKKALAAQVISAAKTT